MTKKLSLSLAIASGLGLFTQHAMAADQVIDLHAGGTQDPAVFAAELAANQPTLTLASGEAFQVRVPVPTYIIDTNNPFFIKFALVGGSKFDNLAAATTALNCALASPGAALADAITKAIASALAAQTATSADVMGTNATGSAAGTVGKLLYDAVVAEDAVSNYATDDTVRQLAVSSAAALKAKTAAILAAVTTADTDAAAVDTADAADDTTVSPTVVKGVTDANVATLTTAAAAAKTAAKTLDDAAEDLVTAINDTIIIAEAAAAAAAVTGADAASVAAAITTALLPTATAATVTAANAAAGGAGNTTAVDAIADVNTYLNGTTAGTAETAAIALDTAGSNANLAAMTTKTIATKDAADVLKAFTDTKAAGTRVVGSDGDQSLTYQLVEPAAGQTKLNSTDVSTDTDVNGKGCLFTFNAVKGMSGNMVNQTLSAVVQYKDGNSLIDVPYSAPIITFAQAAVVSYDKGSNKVIVDVSKSSKLFTTAASNGGEATTVGEKTASLGTVTYKAVSPKPRAADGADYNPVNAITNAILTIKGPALGAVAAATVTGDVNEGAVYLTTTAANCNTGAGANIIDSAKQVGASGTVSFELSNAEAVEGWMSVCWLMVSMILPKGKSPLN
jgi:hypothetical protein